MLLNRRLTATLGFKVAGAIPKILYLGYDVEEAKTAFETAKDKGYFELKVCRNLDLLTCVHRWRSDPVLANVK